MKLVNPATLSLLLNLPDFYSSFSDTGELLNCLLSFSSSCGSSVHPPINPCSFPKHSVCFCHTEKAHRGNVGLSFYTCLHFDQRRWESEELTLWFVNDNSTS
ncbi:hypothetical protein XENOCAPTIV_012762 [Xenoophorus captivus]|uniref:Uncharacterized protein n=1 Tax=Xenoophorus captivus TaxID=1517983 RepID=A0ABV0RQB4_9TELE